MWWRFGSPRIASIAGLKYIGFGGTGKQVRDFLHIDDFCDLVLDQIDNFNAYAGRHWNVGGGVRNSVSLLRGDGALPGNYGTHGERGWPRMRTGRSDLRFYITDHRAVSAVRGWTPQRDARRTIATLRSGSTKAPRARCNEIVFGL